jgi:hypothetical protein
LFERKLFRPLGILSIFASLPILEASSMAAVAFFEGGDTLRTVLSSLGFAGALCLLVAGVALFMRRQAGRNLALWGAGGSIGAHTLGAFIGLVGGHGVLYGVGFPLAIVLLLRAIPSSGQPIDMPTSDPQPTTPHDRGMLTAAVV